MGNTLSVFTMTPITEKIIVSSLEVKTSHEVSENTQNKYSWSDVCTNTPSEEHLPGCNVDFIK